MLALRLFFLAILFAMLALTSWASWHTPIFSIPREVFTHPWFLATLADAYFAFLSFYLWVAWKETSAAARLLWLIAIIALGNLAMSIYVLVESFRVASIDELVTRRKPGRVALPALLAALGVLVYFLA